MIDYLLSEAAFSERLKTAGWTDLHDAEHHGAEILRNEIKTYIEKMADRRNQIDDEAFSYAEKIEELENELKIARELLHD